MSEQQPERTAEQPGIVSALPEPSLSEIEARQAHDEALRRTGRTASGEVMPGAHNRVEEETRRLSERLTREAQERHNALALTKTAPLLTPPTLPTLPTPPVTPEATTSRRLPALLRIHATLVALDGSLFAERALPYAAALAHLTGSAITVGMCARRLGRPASAEDDIETITGVEEARTAEDDTLRRTLLSARDRLIADGLTAQARVVHAPDVANGLLMLRESIGAEVLALASHARAGVERVVLGSVADEVVRHGDGLTLVIPPLTPDPPERGVTFTRALAPLDGSSLSEQTLRVIQPMLQRETAADDGPGWLRSLTLFFVAEDHIQVRDAEVYLHDLREALLREATAPTEIMPLVVLGSAPGAIVARAAGAEEPATPDARHDLIIMATHGRGGAGRWFYGSVATYVLQHSATPVLLVRTTQ